jgi:gamma-glutamylcyclotransferase (GGCT)/AIG2-like uncharacterized protein YtfP
MTETVFVYGILMRDAQVAARLPGYTLRQHGFVTILPDPDGVVYGGLVEVSTLDRYDQVEGVDRRDPLAGYYWRHRVTVDTEDGPVEAWVYEMNRRWIRGEPYEGEPDARMVAAMMAQYDRLGHEMAAATAWVSDAVMDRIDSEVVCDG